MAKSKSPVSPIRRPQAASRTETSPVSDEERRHMIEEAAYFRAQKRGSDGGDPIDDWLAAEREINRLLPSPAQQKRELAAYQKLRADVEKLLADTKDTLSADTIRLALVSARNRLTELGEHTADNIDKAIATIEKEMLDASHRMGARLENYSERTADVFYIWRDRGNRFLEQAAEALEGWAREFGVRLGRQTYRTGEIAASGEFECTGCGEHLRLETPAHLPLCPKCRKAEFRRVA